MDTTIKNLNVSSQSQQLNLIPKRMVWFVNHLYEMKTISLHILYEAQEIEFGLNFSFIGNQKISCYFYFESESKNFNPKLRQKLSMKWSRKFWNEWNLIFYFKHDRLYEVRTRTYLMRKDGVDKIGKQS